MNFLGLLHFGYCHLWNFRLDRPQLQQEREERGAEEGRAVLEGQQVPRVDFR